MTDSQPRATTCRRYRSIACSCCNAGHEPYRALGLVVHEHEILDAQSLKNMARAKAQYNKKYREVRPAQHLACKYS